jgi:tetratricopeptide (TPR) repeat protein
MAHNIDSRASTQSNDLRDLLDRAERQLPSLSAAILEEFLVGLDQIDALFDELASNEADVRSEQTRWQDLLARLQGRAAAVTKMASQHGGLPALRAQHPPAAGLWWRLDELAATLQARKWKRFGVTALVVIAVFIAAALIYRTFFAPSAETVLVVGALSKVEQLAIEQKWPEALAQAEMALATVPDDPDLLLWAGLLAEKLGQTDKATAYLDRARKVVPDPLRFQLSLGMRYLQSGDAGGAEKAAQTAQTLNPKDPQVYFILGNVAELRNQPMDAVALYEKAAALADPDNPQLAVLSKVRMGMLLQQMNLGVGSTPVDASPTP